MIENQKDAGLPVSPPVTPDEVQGTGSVDPVLFRELVVKVGELVTLADDHSALHGLELVACAFAAVLDIYAAPNLENPRGMCDDKAAFRRIFADLIMTAGLEDPAVQSLAPHQEPNPGPQGGQSND
jgi:hypothetical protein